MRLNDVTALSRSVDLHYPTNLAIVVVSLLAGAAGAAWRFWGGAAPLEAGLWGAGAGLTVFLTWALCRELDPDHNLSAFGGAALAVGGLAALGVPELLPIAWQLTALRLVVRTTGLPARPLDSVGLLGLGTWLCWQNGWYFGALTAAVFYLDGQLVAPVRRHNRLAALSLLLTAAVVLLAGVAPRAGWSEPPLIALLGAVLLLFAFVFATQGHPEAAGDATGVPLKRDRVRAGQVLAPVVLLVVAWWVGQNGLAETWPLAVAMLAVALYRFLVVPRLAPGMRPEGRR